MTSDDEKAESRFAVDPKKLAAWISLGTSASSLLTGLATSTHSKYNRVDTAFVYLVYVVLAVVVSLIVAVMAAGFIGFVVSRLLSSSDDIPDMTAEVIFCCAALVSGVLFVRDGLNTAYGDVSTGTTNFVGGTTGIEIVACAIILGSLAMGYRFLYKNR